jgi:pimeloyl-ACP methyl ester carboxylesterase
VKTVASLTPVAFTMLPQVAGQSAAIPTPETYSPSILPAGIRSHFIDNVNGLRVHILEAGFGAGTRPCVLLLHGFPELAFSWRKVMGPLAAAGYHVLAPDLRGYGRTTGWDDRYDTDLRSFGLLNYVRDALALVFAFGYRSLAAVVGHDFGSVVSPWCSIARPDVFRSVVLMSAPFAGAPAPTARTADASDSNKSASRSGEGLDEALAQLTPPRKQYRTYYSTREANADMMHPQQGLRAFLRASYHHEECGLEAEQTAASHFQRRAGVRQAPHLLRNGTGQDHAGDGGPGDALNLGDSGVSLAAGERVERVCG